MKKYPLSSPVDRAAGAAVCAVACGLMAVLVFLLGSDLLTLVIITASVILVGAVLVFYVLNLYKAACTPLPAENMLLVHGYPDCTYDLSGAVSIETVPYKSGSLATRTLIFRNENQDILLSVPTFFFAHQGAKAEPAAKEIAAALGLRFEPSLEPWEYDERLRKIHEKEMAKAEKEARKARFQAIKNKLLRRRPAEKPASTAQEEEFTEIDGYEKSVDGINYDAMDDEK